MYFLIIVKYISQYYNIVNYFVQQSSRTFFVLCSYMLLKILFLGRVLWLTPVIPALWEAEVDGSRGREAEVDRSRGQEIETIPANMVKPHIY